MLGVDANIIIRLGAVIDRPRRNNAAPSVGVLGIAGCHYSPLRYACRRVAIAAQRFSVSGFEQQIPSRDVISRH